MILLERNELVRTNATWGPLQDMAVTGVLSIAIAPKDDGSEAVVTCRINGTPAHALDTLATADDQVVGLQFVSWAAMEAGAIEKPASAKKKP